MGIEPEVCPADLVEDLRPGEGSRAHVQRLARSKGRKVAGALQAGPVPRVVLAADTIVVCDDMTLGKPGDAAEAAAMLRRLAGRSHDVLTSVWISRTDCPRTEQCLESTRVHFRTVPEDLILWYVGTGEPMDKAGAYAIQGHGSLLVEGIEGSWSNVVGLPVERIPTLLNAVGLDLGGVVERITPR
jgi:septum formation protein